MNEQLTRLNPQQTATIEHDEIIREKETLSPSSG